MDSEEEKKRKYALLLGIGFDNKDEHVRITTGKNFKLFGGSKETHEVMQEKAIKFNEALDKRKKELSEVDKEELLEIADEIGLGKPVQKKDGQPD